MEIAYKSGGGCSMLFKFTSFSVSFIYKFKQHWHMDNITLTIIFKIVLAAALGLLVGMEREHFNKPAGMRTYALIAMGATLFTALSYEGLEGFQGLGFDPSRIAAQVVVGVGFIGAGIIFFKGNSVQGLTTAAGIWAVAAMGMAVGFGMYEVAVTSTLLILAILFGVGTLEKKIFKSDYGAVDSKQKEEGIS